MLSEEDPSGNFSLTQVTFSNVTMNICMEYKKNGIWVLHHKVKRNLGSSFLPVKITIETSLSDNSPPTMQ